MTPPTTESAAPFHGWKILALCTFCQFVGIGFTTYLLGVFIDPLATLFNTTQGTIGITSGLFTLVGSFLSPFLGYFADRGKTKVILLLGGCTLASGFVLLSQAQTLLQAALISVCLIAPAATMLGMIPATVMVAQWFSKRLGFALGITAAGISLGGFFMPPLAAWLIGNYGTRTALLVLGVTIVVVLIPVILRYAVVKPADIGQYPDGRANDVTAVDSVATVEPMSYAKIFRQRDFWVIGISVGIISFAGILLITYLTPFAKNSGISLQNGAYFMSLLAISGIAGKFTAGWLSDSISPRRLMTATMALAAMGWLPIIFFNSVYAFAAISSVVGFAMGGMIPLWSTLVALNFGLLNFGRVRGIMALVTVFFTVCPGPFGGYIYDSTGSYATAFEYLWWCLPLGVAVSLLIRKPNSAPEGMAKANTAVTDSIDLEKTAASDCP